MGRIFHLKMLGSSNL